MNTNIVRSRSSALEDPAGLGTARRAIPGPDVGDGPMNAGKGKSAASTADWQPGSRVLATLAGGVVLLTAMWAPSASRADAAATPADGIASTVSVTAPLKRTEVVGRWDVLVTIHTDPEQYAALYCDFRADQRLDCVNKPDYPPLQGVGLWRADRNGFSFWITHHAHQDDQGNPVGAIYAIHLGTVRQDRFATRATTYIAMDDGSPWTGPIDVEARGVRIAANPRVTSGTALGGRP